MERSLDNTAWSAHDTSTKNGYLDVNLTSAQMYYYRVKTQDTSGNVSRPTTILSSQPGAAPDVTAKPTITLQNWKQEYGVRATVTWDTDQYSDSFVVYSKKPLESGASTKTTDGEAAQVVGQFDKTLNHSVLVQQLEPSTKYYIKTLSQNEIKITGASEIVEVTTPERIPLVVSTVRFSNTTNASTTVTWTTNKLSTTLLEYGTSSSYGASLSDTNQNTDHSMKIDNLSPGTTYHVRIKTTDADGNYIISDDYAIDIPAVPAVSDIKITGITYNMATFEWTTNVPADSRVQLRSTSPQPSPQSGEGAPFPSQGEGGVEGSISEQGRSELVTSHAVTVIGLEPNTAYLAKVKSTDAFGNIAQSETKSFSTPADTQAPEISNVKSEVTTSGAGESTKIMAIISFETDEPASARVEYGLGLSGDYPSTTPDSLSYNQSHTLIIPDLKQNASYQYRIAAKDRAGNLSRGEELTLITPPKEKSLLQLVIKSLEETFSWTKRLDKSKYIKPFLRLRR